MRTDILCQCCQQTFANLDDHYCMACLRWLDETFHSLRQSVMRGAVTDFPHVRQGLRVYRGYNHMFMLTGKLLKAS